MAIVENLNGQEREAHLAERVEKLQVDADVAELMFIAAARNYRETVEAANRQVVAASDLYQQYLGRYLEAREALIQARLAHFGPDGEPLQQTE